MFLKNTKYEILTEDGFKDFKGLKSSNHKQYIVLTLDNGVTYKCSKTHLIKTKDGFKQAQTLTRDDVLLQKNKVSKINNIEIKENDEDAVFWDPVGIKGTSSFISKGLTHHNCDEVAYYKKNLWEEFVDSVMPTMNSLIFKQIIMTSTANGMNHFEALVKEAKRSDTSTRFVTTSWRNVPHFKKNGILYTPEEYKKETIKKYGKKFFAQTEACVAGDTIINTLEYGDITISELFEKDIYEV